MASIETSRDYENDLTINTVMGPVTGDEIVRRIVEYHTGEPTKLAIWDFSSADLTRLDIELLKPLAETGKEGYRRRPGRKTALVVPSDLAYGMALMWSALIELEDLPVENRAFRSMKEAKEWLGIGA
jgi:hypothetical protein